MFTSFNILIDCCSMRWMLNSIKSTNWWKMQINRRMLL